MCIVLLDTSQITSGRITLLSNRDEFYPRPTRVIHLWTTTSETPHVMAGKDQQEGGMWLGVDQATRFGVITNFRDPSLHYEDKKSRGWIIRDFLLGKDSPKVYLAKLRAESENYNPFSVLMGDRHGVFYFSSITREVTRIEPGIYGLSNHYFESEWFKVKRLKTLYAEAIHAAVRPLTRNYFELLHDSKTPPDSELPETGVSLEWERLLSSIFIASDQYGTRSSSVVKIRPERVSIAERAYGP